MSVFVFFLIIFVLFLLFLQSYSSANFLNYLLLLTFSGVLSTTGMSTNFVVSIEIPIDEKETEQKWILAGVAALCNLTD